MFNFIRKSYYSTYDHLCMHYRPEIDGLRAIAVLIVLVFHLNSSFLPGGFIGVDIFFVISGFLITSIIKKEVDRGEFSMKKFYVRRMKRLLPLFFSVVVFSLIVGYFLFLPFDYKSLSKDVLAADFFLSNVKYALTTNYFTTDAQVPLLHFWSLSVEEQFYLFFPIIYILLYKRFSKQIPVVFILLFLVSLVLAEYMSSTAKYANYSYLLLPTRAWEMLAGCVLAIISPMPLNKGNNITSILGLILLVLGLVFVNKQSVFPGFITCLPVFGTLLILKSGGNNYVGRLLGNSMFTYIGLASYSIYMWHYPIIAFFKSMYGIEDVNIVQFIILFAVILCVGFLSKHYIEDFFRFNKLNNYAKVARYYFVIPITLTSCFSVFVFVSNGIPFRYEVQEEMIVPFTRLCPFYHQFGCYLTENETSEQVMLLGDSHAEHFTDFFSKWLDKDKSSLSLYAAGGCAFYTNHLTDVKCEELKKQVNEDIAKFSTIIVASRFDNFYTNEESLKEFSTYIEELAEKEKKVVVMMQVPQFKDKKFVKSLLFNKRYDIALDSNLYSINESYALANARIRKELSDVKGVYLLDLNPLLTVNNEINVMDEHDKLLYYDDNHLSAYASSYMLDKIKQKHGPIRFLDFIAQN